jgi:RNA polymerase sigma factor (TIGR02999 family)
VAVLRVLLKGRAKMEPQTTGSAAFGELTQVLKTSDLSDPAIRNRLIEIAYPELKRIAESRMRSERETHTLQPTALVSEFFLLLARQTNITFKNRVHFLAIASRAMKRLLIDHARNHKALKNNGGVAPAALDLITIPDTEHAYGVLEIVSLLDKLALEEPRMAEVVELHCFGGLTFGEIAEVVKVDERTAKRDWQVARAWLFGHLRKGESNAGG